MWHQEEENATEQNTKTYTYKSSQSPIEVVLRYDLLAGLTWGITPVPPAETFETCRTHSSRHCTTCYFAVFVHELIFPEDPLHRKRMVLFLSYSKFSTRKKPQPCSFIFLYYTF